MSADLDLGAIQVHHGDCREVLARLPDCSVDSVVTDPPYELGFMGKAWDASGIAYSVEMWGEVLRVLKPGGHLLAFGGTRTYHRMAVAIEDAGFEIRDSIHWLYGSGFPKSLDVSKAIDKAAGAEREVVGYSKGVAVSPDDNQYGGINRGAVGIKQVGVDVPVTAPATDAAKKWQGWGTALKPAHEPIVLARKPLIGTVASNVLESGTGALNIDGCRVETSDSFGGGAKATSGFVSGYEHDGWKPGNPSGRWPANVILDTEAGAVLDEQSGERISGSRKAGTYAGKTTTQTYGAYGQFDSNEIAASTGGASRFFTSIEWEPEIDVPFRYVAKPSKRERTCEGTVANGHPTLKPLELMRWLVRLVTPPGGTVLEPFAGSGTTLMACVMEGFHGIGIEMTDDYLPIIEGRVRWAQSQHQELTLDI